MRSFFPLHSPASSAVGIPIFHSAEAARLGLAERDVSDQPTIFSFLQPDVGYSILVLLIYFSVWIGALGWDILSHLPFDFNTLFLKQAFTWRNPITAAGRITYLFSRPSVFVFALLVDLFYVTPASDCARIPFAFHFFFALAHASAAFIFLVRACSLVSFNRALCIPLSALYAITVAWAIAIFGTTDAAPIPGSPYCQVSVTTRSAEAGFAVSSFVFYVFLTAVVAGKMITADWESHLKGKTIVQVVNEVAWSIVNYGLHYYFFTTTALLAQLVSYFATSRPAYKALNLVLAAVISSTMAGRLYRAVCVAANEATVAANISSFSSTAPNSPNDPNASFISSSGGVFAAIRRGSGVGIPSNRTSSVVGGVGSSTLRAGPGPLGRTSMSAGGFTFSTAINSASNFSKQFSGAAPSGSFVSPFEKGGRASPSPPSPGFRRGGQAVGMTDSPAQTFGIGNRHNDFLGEDRAAHRRGRRYSDDGDGYGGAAERSGSPDVMSASSTTAHGAGAKAASSLRSPSSAQEPSTTSDAAGGVSIMPISR